MTSSSGYSGGSTPTHQTASTSAGLSLATLKWQVEHDAFLSDFIERQQLPHLALITKGQHLSIGAPNIANPNLKPYVLVHSMQNVTKIIGQLIRLKDNGKRLITTTQKVAIPEYYSGYFEILSENCKPVKCIESVAELSKRFPELCLTRQSCKAYLPDLTGELRNLYKTRTVHEGELLTLVGQFNYKTTQFLRCFDEQGQSVYLKMTSKGRFSPIASKKDSITGVHTVNSLLQKRLPLTVRLIQGSRGSNAAADLWKVISATNSSISPTSGPFSGAANVDKNFVIRLLNVCEERLVFVHSIQSSATPLNAFQSGVNAASLSSLFTLLPISAHLKLAPALNQSQLMHVQSPAAEEFQQLCDHCDLALTQMLDKIQPYNDHVSGTTTTATTTSTASMFELAASNGGGGGGGVSVKAKDEDEDSALGRPASACDDEEIDQLYDYIRGLMPLPDGRERPDDSPPTQQRGPVPPPPPIETIPSSRGFMVTTSPVAARTLAPVPEQRLDAIVYGNGAKVVMIDVEAAKARRHQAPGSKSMERLSQKDLLQQQQQQQQQQQHGAQLISSRMPARYPPQAPNSEHSSANTSGVSLRQRRPRPMSMVIPDNVAILPDPYAPSAYFLGGAPESQFASPFRHVPSPNRPVHARQPQYLCQSFLDLSIAEENHVVPSAATSMPMAGSHAMHYSPYLSPYGPVPAIGRPTPQFYPPPHMAQPAAAAVRYNPAQHSYQRPSYRV